MLAMGVFDLLLAHTRFDLNADRHVFNREQNLCALGEKRRLISLVEDNDVGLAGARVIRVDEYARAYCVHWLRDTCYREDTSRARTRSGPRILASLRNLAIGALRLAGRHDITEATRWANRYMNRPFTILGLTL